MKEIWKPVKDFEDLYEISNLGRVKSLERISIQNHLIPEKILKQTTAQGGYYDVSLYKDGKRYHRKPHRMVAEAFVPNPRNLNEVDHIDTDKSNNCADNLRWCTHSENHLNPLTVELKRKNMKRLGTPKGFAEYRKKITKTVKVYKDGVLMKTFYGLKALEKESKNIFGVRLWGDYVNKCVRGEIDNYHGFTFEFV